VGVPLPELDLDLVGTVDQVTAGPVPFRSVGALVASSPDRSEPGARWAWESLSGPSR
jgi:hypothetical protein